MNCGLHYIRPPYYLVLAVTRATKINVELTNRRITGARVKNPKVQGIGFVVGILEDAVIMNSKWPCVCHICNGAGMLVGRSYS